MTTREEIALRLFAALLGRTDSKIDLYPDLGDKQIRTCFALADTFIAVSEEDPEYVAER